LIVFIVMSESFMAEKKRTFEIHLHPGEQLALQPRTARTEPGEMPVQDGEPVPTLPAPPLFGREVVERLIDWFRKG
jgi:hypothetical protein